MTPPASRAGRPIVDLVVRGARTTAGATVDVAVDGGLVVEVGAVTAIGREQLDAAGGLVSEAFVEPHFHLDKCLNTDLAPDLPDLEDYLEAEKRDKDMRTAATVSDRACRALQLLVGLGVRAVRAQVDVDTVAGLRGLEGVLTARETFAGLIDVRITAFPQLGILADPGVAPLLQEALRSGADSIGGHPQLESDREAAREHLRLVFGLAEQHDVDVDLHCDESDDPSCRYVLDVAEETMRRGWHGRVAAAHLSTLELLDPDTRSRSIDALAEAGITAVCNPTSNLMFRGRRSPHPRPRGLPPVLEMRERGVRVVLGQENYKSFFITTLRHPDPVLTAHIFAYGAQAKSPGLMPVIWDMVTGASADLFGLPSGLTIGAPATFNVFPTPDVTETLATVPPRRWVLRDGRVVSESVVTTRTETPAGSRP